MTGGRVRWGYFLAWQRETRARPSINHQEIA